MRQSAKIWKICGLSRKGMIGGKEEAMAEQLLPKETSALAGSQTSCMEILGGGLENF